VHVERIVTERKRGWTRNKGEEITAGRYERREIGS
jgi:hypothetical protein